MGSTRMRGNKLALTFGSPGTDYWADAKSVKLENEDSAEGIVTFEDAAGQSDPRKYYFTIEAIQSTQTTSFWRYVWENTGQVVAFTYAPHGNAVASADEPHFLGTCRIGPKPTVGGEASRTNTYTFETRFDIETGPTLDTGV